jgi:protein TonB
MYHSNALASIELTLEDVSVSRPVERRIPRPPRRLKTPPLIRDTKPPKAEERPIPPLKPLRMEPVASVASPEPVERITMPRVSDTAPPSVAAWHPEPAAEPAPAPTVAPPMVAPSAPVATRVGYFALVREAIERKKEYPEVARTARIEGRVTVAFVIETDGTVRDVEIVAKSRSRYLNEAAVNAVKGAAPFPRPPKSLFEGSIKLKVVIVFELR